ncbi:hypothetical protein HOY80DRAFT_548422 [Tuber brumale]|nr:hypothetical protein HOY80DRAFT_548422 [Tuber brumale]
MISHLQWRQWTGLVVVSTNIHMAMYSILYKLKRSIGTTCVYPVSLFLSHIHSHSWSRFLVTAPVSLWIGWVPLRPRQSLPLKPGESRVCARVEGFASNNADTSPIGAGNYFPNDSSQDPFGAPTPIGGGGGEGTCEPSKASKKGATVQEGSVFHRTLPVPVWYKVTRPLLDHTTPHDPK